MKQLTWFVILTCLAVTSPRDSRGQESSAKTPPGHEVTEPKTGKSAPSPGERYRDVLKSFETAQAEFMAAYRAAKTDDERRKVIDAKYPKPDGYADKMLEIARDAPKDPVAVEALIWV